MNFRRILSKGSLKSSSSSGKSKIDELKKLQDEIESLKLNISSLKVLLDNRDAALGKIACEKEKLYVRHKTLLRENKYLHQELVDERTTHSKEKDFLLKNMKKLSLKLANSGKDYVSEEEEVISTLQNEMKSKDEVIHNVCTKYMKLRKSKKELQQKFEALQVQTHEIFKSIITTLEDNKNALDSVFEELRNKINPSHKKYIKLLKVNADLNFENTQLKLFLIAKNELRSGDKEAGLSGIKGPQCSHTHDQLKTHKNCHQERSTSPTEKLYKPSKTNESK
ncbi:uncharacterized protein LOC112054747 isoform X1 [Bicyclus anynana]|uniref:Uncharacterized protein LOC112054747 isoform X1 n=1 Tax=Bicyclus anynana TaxID=110368 RepID=A0ABM3M2G4_BICAN|nr:uncharacterized protein LOC112054747 isoform X1 [Bicyclus anynana]